MHIDNAYNDCLTRDKARFGEISIATRGGLYMLIEHRQFELSKKDENYS